MESIFIFRVKINAKSKRTRFVVYRIAL
jgi:hypothetical protein